MASWDELRTHAEETFGAFSIDTGGMFAVDLTYDDGRTQKVYVRQFTARGREFFELRTLVCKQTELEPCAATPRAGSGSWDSRTACTS